MNIRNYINELYFARKLEPIHKIQSLIAKLEKSLYRQGVLSSKNLSLPAFLGIGAPKAGTTWLYNMLSANPDIFMPRTKEIHYFDRRYDELLYMYTRKFKAGKSLITGEITPAYSILEPERIEFIHLIMPEVKLIYLLRNPIERAWSEAMHLLLRKANYKTLNNVPDTVLENILNTDEITMRSAYTDNLDKWLSIFPQEQLLVLFYDDLKKNPRLLLEQVFSHIGISSNVNWENIPLSNKFNVNPTTKIPDKYNDLLREQYRAEIEKLYQRFGDKVTGWCV